ncbi:MAG: hypothetical protein Q9174_003802 [Haloplaca sp. 1 TL-2023]
MELDIAQRALADAEAKCAKCHNHVRDDRAYFADVSTPKNGRSSQTSMRFKKAQQTLRKWEENLADAKSRVQECARDVQNAKQRMAKNQAIR